MSEHDLNVEQKSANPEHFSRLPLRRSVRGTNPEQTVQRPSKPCKPRANRQRHRATVKHRAKGASPEQRVQTPSKTCHCGCCLRNHCHTSCDSARGQLGQHSLRYRNRAVFVWVYCDGRASVRLVSCEFLVVGRGCRGDYQLNPTVRQDHNVGNHDNCRSAAGVWRE